MRFTDAEVASVLRVLPKGEGQAATIFERVSTDTREDLRGCLFVALKGERFNAHDFIPAAVKGGACGIVHTTGEAPEGVLSYRVEDTLEALGALGLAARRKLGAKVAAITGSFGKTTTKEMAVGLIALAGVKLLHTRGNLNNRVGLPKTLLSGEGGERYAVVELGISLPGEMSSLSAICEPDVALITGVGAAHTEGLGDVATVAAEKLKVAEALKIGGTLILPHGAPLLGEPAWLAGRKAKIATFGFEEGATVRGENFESLGVEGSRFSVGGRVIRVGPPGRHNATNALAAWAVAEALGVEIPDTGEPPLLKGLAGMRGEVRRTKGGANLLVDCYNANPGAVLAALDTLAELAGDANKVVVLGEMKELGDLSEASHREVGRRVAQIGAAKFIAYGAGAAPAVRAALMAGMAGGSAKLAASHQEIIGELQSPGHTGDWILIKGSRSTRLDAVADALAPSVLESV